MTKKTVQVSYEWWQATLEIDESEKTTESMKEQLLFWMSGQERIDEENGDITAAYSKLLVPELMEYSQYHNIRGIQKKIAELEGWSPIDGSCGVRLLEVDSWIIQSDNIFVDEVSNEHPN